MLWIRNSESSNANLRGVLFLLVILFRAFFVLWYFRWLVGHQRSLSIAQEVGFLRADPDELAQTAGHSGIETAAEGPQDRDGIRTAEIAANRFIAEPIRALQSTTLESQYVLKNYVSLPHIEEDRLIVDYMRLVDAGKANTTFWFPIDIIYRRGSVIDIDIAILSHGNS